MATSPFVGRSLEIQKLRDSLIQTLDGKPTLVFLSGEAGVGKSRIVKEFIESAKITYPQMVTAVGECNCHYGYADPLLPFRAISAEIFDEHPDKPKRTQSHSAFKKVAEVIAEIAPDTVGVFIPLAGLGLKLLHILGKTALAKPITKTDDPVFGRVAVFEQYSQLLFWAAKHVPLLLVLEDLHWSDAATLDFLFYLVRSWTTQKIMVVGTYRPSDVALAEDHPLQQIEREMVRYGLCYQMDVGWLSESAVSEWLEQSYCPNAFSEDFIRLIYKRTEGNALFVDEILKFLQESGALHTDDSGTWVLTAQINDTAGLPTTIVAVLEQRLARLESTMRDVLTCASVEGEEFTAQVVAAIRHLEEDDVLRALEDVFDRRLRLVALKEEHQLADRRWLTVFEFRHTLMQNYLYSTLSAPRRRRLHQLVGNYLEEFYGEHPDSIAPILALHFTEAGDVVKSLKYGLLSAGRAENAYDYRAARVWLEKVVEQLDIVKPDPLTAADILRRLGRVQFRTGDFVQSESSFLRALGYVPDGAEGRSSFRVLTDLAYLYTSTDRSDEAARILERAIRVAEETNPNSDLAYAYLHRALAYQKAARHDQHFAYLVRARDVFEGIDDNAGLADVDRALGIYYKITGDFDQSIEHLTSSINIHRDLGDKYGEALDYTNLGSTYFVVRHDAARAIMCYQRSLDLCREVFAVHEEAHVLLNMGRVYGLDRDWSRAASYVERGLQLSEKVGRAYDSIRARWYLGIVYHFKGLSDRALEIYNQVLEPEVHDPWLLWPILCNLGSVEVVAGRLHQGLTSYKKACDLLLSILEELPKSEHRQFLEIQNRVNVFRLLRLDARRIGQDQLVAEIEERIPLDLLGNVDEYLPRFYWGGGMWV